MNMNLSEFYLKFVINNDYPAIIYITSIFGMISLSK